MIERQEVKCLSPLEWRIGWLKSLLVFGVVVAVMLAFQARAHGADFSIGIGIAAVLAFLGAYLWPSTVTLLEDGLAFKRFGRTKFIPYSKIKKTESLQRLGSGSRDRQSKDATYTVYCGLRLHLDGGETVDIGTSAEELNSLTVRNWTMGQYGDFGAFSRKGWELKQALDRCIDDALGAPEPTTPMAEGLMRGEKSPAEWLAAIKAAAPAKGEAYRGAEGAHEALWRVLEDDQSPREARAGAALALRSHLDEEGRNRMRVVVDTCESPKLRVAIETALDEEAGEPRLLHALEQASLPREES